MNYDAFLLWNHTPATTKSNYPQQPRPGNGLNTHGGRDGWMDEMDTYM